MTTDHGKLTLDNGAEIFYGRSERLGGACHCQFEIGSGSGVEPYNKRGLAHFLEHMTFKNSRNYKGEGEISERANELGFSASASTGFEITQYPFSVRGDNFLSASNLILDAIFYPLFRQDTFDREKRVVLNESRRYYDEVNSKIFRLFNQTFFRGTPLEELVIGREDHIPDFQREDLLNFHEKNFVASNLKAFMYGGINQVQIDGLASILSSLPQKTKPEELKFTLPPLLDSERIERYIPHLLQAYCISSFRTVSVTHEDIPALGFLHRLLSLHSGKQSLFKKIREEKGLVYHLGCVNYSDKRFGYFGFQFDSNPDDLDEVFDRAREVLFRVNPSEKDMNTVRTMIENDRQVLNENPLTSFNNFTAKSLGQISPDDFYGKLLGVTPEDIKRVLLRYLINKPSQTVILSPGTN